MPRLPHQYSPECAYHIIARGNNRQTLFAESVDFQRFLFLRALKEEYPLDWYYYCLISNHVHLLARFSEPLSFPKVSQRLFLRYAQYFARKYRHVGHAFQDRFRGLPVADNRYLLDCGRYIERNPVKAKLVRHRAEYPWSSFLYYGRGCPNDLVTGNPLNRDLGTDVDRHEKYEAYVKVERPYEAALEQILLGLKRKPKVSL